MSYVSMQDCIDDLEKHGRLIRITEEVDPYLEMASIHLRIHEAKGKAVLFEKVRGSKYRAVSNLFGTTEQSQFLFRNTLDHIKKLIEIKNDPLQALKHPFKNLSTLIAGYKSLPKKVSSHDFEKINISDLPQVQCWEKDGGAFITLPIVYTEDPDKPGVMASNLGMYRIQMNGNDYVPDKEIGLHYQIHRGIGVHQTKWNALGKPMKVSVFVGGPPAHSFAAVMPLPEGLSELTFAGALGGRRFRYMYDEEGFLLSTDSDFVITGEVYPHENKPEGPFGDHLGYYSLKHDFPVMRVKNVYAKKNAIWSFTVVGRPPQEDTAFGNMIHEMTGDAIGKEIPGLQEVHAVDAAGVHPLLLAIGSERYTPYATVKAPQEILTIANHILGTGQLSLAKYLFIAEGPHANLSTHEEEHFFHHILERINWRRDIHFHTKTTMDTLDYSGEHLNAGSKVVIAAAGESKRELKNELPANFSLIDGFSDPHFISKGILAIKTDAFENYIAADFQIRKLEHHLQQFDLSGIPMMVLCDDAEFISAQWSNFLWATFTRSNPSHDIYGVREHVEHKHWGCDTLIIDARIKPHHAPLLEKNAAIEKKVDELLKNYSI